jgi:hypothetical protein
MSAGQRPKKRPRRPIYLRCEVLVRPETGEAVRAWTALTKWDARAMKDRGYHAGTEVRAEMKKPRNPMFHRLAHAMGALMVDQHAAFEGTSAHDALKRLQMESGAACEVVEYELPDGLGTLKRKEPRSLAFDEMDEGLFQEVMRTIVAHIRAKYWPELSEDAIAELIDMYDKEHAA